MLSGLIITPLKQFSDDRGKVMKMLSREDPWFAGFGEIYFSLVFPRKVKGWYRHSKMTLNYAVPQGRIKLVIYDDREGSITRSQLEVIYLGLDSYNLVTVPPSLWYGFTADGTEPALVANCASLPHDPNENERRSLLDPLIPYDWSASRT